MTKKKEKIEKIKKPEEIFEEIKKVGKIDPKAKKLDKEPTIDDIKAGVLPEDGTRYIIQELKKIGVHVVLEEAMILDNGEWKKDTIVRYSEKNDKDIYNYKTISYRELVTGKTFPKKHLLFVKA